MQTRGVSEVERVARGMPPSCARTSRGRICMVLNCVRGQSSNPSWSTWPKRATSSPWVWPVGWHRASGPRKRGRRLIAAHSPGHGRFAVLGSRVKRKPRRGAGDDGSERVSRNGGSGRGVFGSRIPGPVRCGLRISRACRAYAESPGPGSRGRGQVEFGLRPDRWAPRRYGLIHWEAPQGQAAHYQILPR